MLVALLCAAVATEAVAVPPQITEFPIPPPASFPVNIARGPDGAMWFTLQTNDAVARVDSAGQVTEFPLSDSAANPLDIAAGPDGNLWFTESGVNRIGRITPAGALTEFTVATASKVPYEITAGPDGALWFTEQSGNAIGRITVQGVVTNEFPVLTAGALPQGIGVGPDGAIWFTELGGKVGRITTQGTVTEFPVPTAGAGPGSIALGSDGNLWFTEYFANQIGRITPTGSVTEFPIPTADSHPVAIAAWPKGGALWFTENTAHQLGRISTAGAITEFPTPTAQSSPVGISPGPEAEGSVWFTEQSTQKVARLTEPVPAVDCPACRSALPAPLTFDQLNAKDPPTLGKDVNVAPAGGQVFISEPSGGAARASRSVPGIKGRRFVPLTSARQIPVGSLLDTRSGTIRLASDSTRGSRLFIGDFSGGVFQVLQSRRKRARGLTELRLKGSSFGRCRTGSRRSAAPEAMAARRRIRRLRGTARGRFRTRGRYSAATVRGTTWTVIDRCDGTLTTVRRGSVVVRDFRRRRNILVRQGKRYLARAP